ncbi:hypothetical protein P3X46_013956, partial [Hevea brasiliensis]
FILVAIDYFSKWVEATSYAHITQNTFLKFFKSNIICRHGLPNEIVTDNAKNLNGPKVQKLDWHDMLPYALHAYRTSVRTSTGATPYSLVYGMEAVLPIEVEIPSLRILKESGIDKSEWIQSRLDQLNLLDEKRLTAACHGQLY